MLVFIKEGVVQRGLIFPLIERVIFYPLLNVKKAVFWQGVFKHYLKIF